MAVTLEMAMRECNNFFERCKYAGEIRIAGGKIVPDVGSPYVYISGSARNDGVHSLVSGAMEDADGEETFDGTLWFLYPPRPFIEIAKECAEYETKNPTGAYTSLCLHTLRADCNGRNAQNCNMHFSERVLSW